MSNHDAVRRSALLRAAILGLMFHGGAALAADLNAVRDFDIQPQRLDAALLQFSKQSDMQVIGATAAIEDIQTKGVSGKLTNRQALEALLRGTRLTYGPIGERSVRITHLKRTSATGASPGGDARLQLARAFSDDEARDEAKHSTETASGDAVVEAEELIVTGSRVKGAPPVSPVTTITQMEIKQAGYSDLGEVIRDLPQNFSGGQNPGGAVQVYSGPGNGNATGGSALNLRGLGPDATLTLLNGRRLAFNGGGQAIDISAIPVEAVDRIEVVADGASALYGSDAVAGVANVILKRDYEGAAVRARYGASTDGGADQQQYSIVGGRTWGSGGFIASYEYKQDEPIYAHERSYLRYMEDPYMLYPELERNNFLFSVHQDLSDSVTLSLDSLYNDRSQFAVQNVSILSVGIVDNASCIISPALSFSVGQNWSLEVAGTYGEDEMRRAQSYYFLDGAFASSSQSTTRNIVESLDIGAEGSVLRLPGGDARLAVGVGSRRNEIVIDAGSSGIDGDQRSRFAYAELHLPLISAKSSIAFADRLSLNVAARYEDYDGIGDIATPKVGLVYSPTADFELRASWGRSFKAPTLTQRYSENYVYLYLLSQFGEEGYPEDAAMLAINGGSKDLVPEEATTWVGTLALHPRATPGLEAELSYFSVKYDKRVLSPYAANQTVFTNPELLDFAYLSPSSELQQQFIGLAPTGLTNLSGRDYIPENVVVLQDGRFTNVSFQRIHGVDLALRYRIEFQTSDLQLTGSASWLQSEQRTLPTSPSFDLAGMVFNPPHLKARVGATWSGNQWTVATFLDHSGGIRNTFTGSGAKTAAMTTLDASVAYRGESATGVLRDVELILAVQNLLDREPPHMEPRDEYFMSYDPTNYSPLGRFVSVSVAKRW